MHKMGWQLRPAKRLLGNGLFILNRKNSKTNMRTQTVVAAPPKRTAKAMSRAQLEKQLEGTGVTPSKPKSKKELSKDVINLDKPSNIGEGFTGEY